jgi:hypothetical protein
MKSWLLQHLIATALSFIESIIAEIDDRFTGRDPQPK